MTKLEEIARAMDQELWSSIPNYELPRAIQISREISLNRARAALEAMKNPTIRMFDAGYKAAAFPRDPEICSAMFNAMIQAALDEK